MQLMGRPEPGRLGFDPRDVRDIVLTHLDFDHAAWSRQATPSQPTEADVSAA